MRAVVAQRPIKALKSTALLKFISTQFFTDMVRRLSFASSWEHVCITWAQLISVAQGQQKCPRSEWAKRVNKRCFYPIHDLPGAHTNAAVGRSRPVVSVVTRVTPAQGIQTQLRFQSFQPRTASSRSKPANFMVHLLCLKLSATDPMHGCCGSQANI